MSSGKRIAPPPKGHPKTSSVVLILMGLFLLAFIITMTVIFCVKGAVPDTLIDKVLDGSIWEAAALALIKVSKVIAGKKPGEREDT